MRCFLVVSVFDPEVDHIENKYLKPFVSFRCHDAIPFEVGCGTTEHHGPPPQFSLCSHPAIPLATETPKLPASIVGWCPKMHLSHGNLDLLLPLTHAEHSLHSVQSDVAMKTLHLPAKKKRLRQSWISPCPPCRPDRQLGPDESSSAAGDAGQVFCPPDHGASSVFHSAS